MKHFPQGLFQGVIPRSVVLLLLQGWGSSTTDVQVTRGKVNLQVNYPQFSELIILKPPFLPLTCCIVA